MPQEKIDGCGQPPKRLPTFALSFHILFNLHKEAPDLNLIADCSFQEHLTFGMYSLLLPSLIHAACLLSNPISTGLSLDQLKLVDIYFSIKACSSFLGTLL